MKRGDRRGLEKDNGAVNGKAGTGKVKCEGDKDGSADALGKALSRAADEGGPSLPPLSPLALAPLPLLPEPLLLLMG